MDLVTTTQDYALTQKESLTIDEIQDLVEKGLMSTKRKDVAKEYITYRDMRDKLRTRNSQLRKNIIKKLKAKDVQSYREVIAKLGLRK